MEHTLKRIKNPETLAQLGKRLREHREQKAIAQGKVHGMRQATVSKIENGGDVTLDTFVSYANALGLDIALVPIGQRQLSFISGGAIGAVARKNLERFPVVNKSSGAQEVSTQPPQDLLSEFSDLRDDET